MAKELLDYFQPQRYWQNIKTVSDRISFHNLIFQISILVIVFAFLKLPDYDFGIFSFVNNNIIEEVLTLALILAFYLVIMVLGSFLLNIVLKIYKIDSNFHKTGFIVFFSIVPADIIAVVLDKIPFSEPAFRVISGLLIAYIVYLSYHGILNIYGKTAKKSNTILSLIVFGILLYIIYLQNLQVVIAYLAILFIIYYFRDKIDFEGIALLKRTKIGIKSMDKIAKKIPSLLNFLAITGVGVGYLGMIGIVYYISLNLYQLIFIPGSLPGLSPVLPGVKIPGSPIVLPLWYGIISIFIVAAIHEFSHGVIARLHNIKIKNTGILLFGPFIGGAFVDLDEKQLSKAKKKKQLSVLGAGPFSNIVVALFLMIFFGLTPLLAVNMGYQGDTIMNISDKISIINFASVYPKLYEPIGLHISEIVDDSGAYHAGLQPDTTITHVNGHSIKDNTTEFLLALYNTTPNNTIILSTDIDSWAVVPGHHPDNSSMGYMGIKGLEIIKQKSPEAINKYSSFGITLLDVLFKFIFWLFVISFGIGIANLLPIGPVDGGRMLLILLLKFYPEKKAKVIWQKISAGILFLILLILLMPFFKSILASLV